MNQKPKHPPKRTECVDLFDYCAYEELASITEDGLHLLMNNANKMGLKGWNFVCCSRTNNEIDHNVVYLSYERESETNTGTDPIEDGEL